MLNSLITFAAPKPVNSVAGGNTLIKDVTDILTAIIAALGLVAVVVMIIGGVNYLTSAGDSSKVEKGKKTILYGAIGLIICALAFAIVQFVIGTILGGGSSDDGEKEDAYVLDLSETA